MIGANGLSVTDAARVLGVGRPALSAVLNGRASLSPDMALRCEKAFGISMDLLLKMQLQFDIAQVRKAAAAMDAYLGGDGTCAYLQTCPTGKWS